MGSKNEQTKECCNVNLTLHLQNDIHSGFWIFNRKGVGMVIKSRRQNVYLLKVHILLFSIYDSVIISPYFKDTNF